MPMAFEFLDLKVLLKTLPKELPLPDNAETSDYSVSLPPFEILEPVLQCIEGDIPEAVAETIRVTFFVDGEVLITECRPAICAVADVLTTYLATYPKHPSLKKWVKRIADAARKMRNSDTVTEVPERPGMKQFRDLQVVPKKQGRTAGHPGDEILSKLTIKYTHKNTGRYYWACVGINTGCTFYRAGNPQKNRILPHAAHCRFLSDELRVYAEDTASMSLGAKLEHASMTPDLESTSPCDNQSSSVPDHNSMPVKAQTWKLAPVPSTLELDFMAAGSKMMQEKVNHCIMKLICINGLVPNILDSDNWAKYFLNGYEGSEERHTAQWVKVKILKTVESVGED
ncbi:hypothetical protein L208DRAFT_1377294 [Tricholoma matsutake]|nr:hypothetical protein L208DRAFT_1377294 [Tricholoma matsutake 945]